MSKAVELVLGGTIKLVAREIEDESGCFLTISYDGFTITAEGDVMYTLPVDKQVKCKVSYVDSAGNPATVDGPVKWTSSNDGIARVWSDEETSQEAVVAPVAVGQVQIVAAADADLGEGTRALLTTMDITVVAGEAVAGVIEPVGEPGNIPHPSPRT